MASAVIFVLASLLVAANGAKLPPTWKVCARGQAMPEYEKCIMDALMGVAGELTKNGAPTLGVPPMEPLVFPALEIGQGTGPVAIDIKFKDMKLKNLNTVQVDKIRHNIEKYKFGADVHLTKPLVVDSQYDLSGKVLVLPIKGKGICHLEFDNFRAYFNMSGGPIKKGGDEYFKVDVFDLTFDTDKFRVKFDNLFDGNKELGDNMNVFLNENWDVILKEMKPAISQAMAAAFKSISNQIFTRIPIKELSPVAA